MIVKIETPDGRVFEVQQSCSFRLGPCLCSENCGNVNLVLENENGEPFACAQFTHQQVLEGFVEAALEARDKQQDGGKPILHS